MKLRLQEYLETGMFDLEEQSISYGELAYIDSAVKRFQDQPDKLKNMLAVMGVELED